MYDYIIIGGGITGLYTLHQLEKKYKNKQILLVDERDYFGGRLITHKKPHYEIGGARFNDNHVLLLKLIQEFKLTKVPLSSDKIFIQKTKNDTILFDHVNEVFDSIMHNIIQKSKDFTKHELQQYTLKQFIDRISGSTTLSKQLIHIFGYDSEFTKMNCYDSILSLESDFISNHFYVLKEGLSALMNNIYQSHRSKSHITFKQNMKILNISKESDGYTLNCNKNHTFMGKKIIIAVKSEQLKQFKILSPIFPLLKHIYSAALLRIYAIYPKQNGKVWFQDMPITSTNSFLRQIIPIDYNSGLIMISYTDNDDIAPFYKDKRSFLLKSESVLKKMIHDEIQVLFPNKKIPKPTYFKPHLWEIGVHHWKPKCDSVSVYRKIVNPIKDIYIVGEAFSQKQAWMEGGLETVQSIMAKL